MKIGAMAEQLGVSVRTIRYYEERGLLEAQRTDGQTRYYTQGHLHRLQAIIKLVDAGFSIDTIHSLATVRRESASGHASQYKLTRKLMEMSDDLENQIERLILLKQEILSARNALVSCRNCQNRPTTKHCPDCAISSSLNNSTLLNLLWDSGGNY